MGSKIFFGKPKEVNEFQRKLWIKQKLQTIPKGARILDAGAGEQQFKTFCSHLRYVSQDFAQYDGSGDNKGLHTGKWNQSNLDIISDISCIPEHDSSFDAIMCIEVFEHLPNPLLALEEFSRLLHTGGILLITAPFCSLTHFAPYHFASGFNQYWYEKHLPECGYGNYFEYLIQELQRINSMATRYAKQRKKAPFLVRIAIKYILKYLEKLSLIDTGSNELLYFGCHVLAKKE